MRRKYQLGNVVRHSNNPQINYVVQAIDTKNDTYDLVPLNADFDSSMDQVAEGDINLIATNLQEFLNYSKTK